MIDVFGQEATDNARIFSLSKQKISRENWHQCLFDVFVLNEWQNQTDSSVNSLDTFRKQKH